jgi:hypothetical protein
MEEFFLLNQHMNLSISDIRKLPVRVRHWFIKRVVKKFDETQKINKNQSNQTSKKPAKDIDMNKVDKFFAKFGE